MIFWKVFKGNHLAYTEHVEQFNGKSLQVETEKALFGHVDGEFFAVPSKQKLHFSVSEFQLKRVTDNHSIQENDVKQVKVI